MTGRTGGDAGVRTAVDPAVVTAALAELENADSGRLATERTSIEGTLSNVLAAAGDDFDLSLAAVSAIDGFGGTRAERATKMIELHSRLAAVTELEHGQHRATVIRNEILAAREEGNRDIRDSDVYARGTLRREVRQTLADRVYAALEESYGTREVVAAMAAAGVSRRGAISLEHAHDVGEYLAAAVTTDAGWDPFVIRQPGHTAAISRPLQVYQTLPMSMTDQHSIKYMVQTTRDASDVVEKAEGAVSGEADMAWTEFTEEMREIPAHIPVTEIQLEDESQVRATIDSDLRLMVMQLLDGQLINGDGAGVNIRSIRHPRNHGNPAGYNGNPVDYDWTKEGGSRSDQISDAKKAKTRLVLAGRVMPNVYYFHHNVWDEISLSETTAAGYYLGSPANDFVERLWGLPVVQTDHLSDSNAAESIGALCADTMYMRLWVRRALHSEIGWNDTDFVQRRLTIRAGIRACVQVRRPQAVATFTM